MIGGIIGGGVDAQTDAHWNTADSLILHRNNCGQNNLTSSSQSAPPSQKVQGNQAAGKTNYIVAPRPSWLTAVDARDKDDCELIMSITKSVGGAGDSSQFVKNAKNSAITEAINNGADAYFIVSTESNLYGASVTLEALNCR